MVITRISILSLTRRQYTPALPRIPRTLHITSAGRRQGSSVRSQTLLERAERRSGRHCSLRNFLSQKLLILDRAMLPARQRQRPDPPQHVAEQSPVQMPLNQQQPIIPGMLDQPTAGLHQHVLQARQ